MNRADPAIEDFAQDIVWTYGINSVPVDPFAIAKLESILLAPGHYDGSFDSRIEYHRRDKKGRFYLFYEEESVRSRQPVPAAPNRYSSSTSRTKTT